MNGAVDVGAGGGPVENRPVRREVKHGQEQHRKGPAIIVQRARLVGVELEQTVSVCVPGLQQDVGAGIQEQLDGVVGALRARTLQELTVPCEEGMHLVYFHFFFPVRMRTA